MSDYIIRVIIEARHGEKVAEAWTPLPGTFYEAIQPIKVSDGALPIFDTPTDVVRRVMHSREGYAKMLTPKIAEVLLDAMAAKDLLNGYTKEERKQFEAMGKEAGK